MEWPREMARLNLQFSLSGHCSINEAPVHNVPTVCNLRDLVIYLHGFLEQVWRGPNVFFEIVGEMKWEHGRGRLKMLITIVEPRNFSFF